MKIVLSAKATEQFMSELRATFPDLTFHRSGDLGGGGTAYSGRRCLLWRSVTRGFPRRPKTPVDSMPGDRC